MTTQDPLDLRVPYEIIPTDVPGVFISPPPPADFDPNTASRQSLIRNGFLWRRPEAGDDPALRAAWDRAFSRQWRAEDRLVPEFEPRTGKTHRLRHVRRADGGLDTNSTWAGSVLDGDWSVVFGFWQIPRVTRTPSEAPGGWTSASWVGLGGYNETDTGVFQAGVDQDLDQDGNATYYAWHAWSPYFASHRISNFQVSDGEIVLCSLTHFKNQSSGQVWFANASTGVLFTTTLIAAEGAAFNSSSAEWIMEATSGPAALPVFTPNVEFNTAGCCGVTGNGPVVGSPGAPGAFNVNIVEQDTDTQLTEVRDGAGTTTITYTGPG